MVISTQRNQVFFHMTNVDLISQLVEGAFPHYQRLIPASSVTRTVMDTSSLRDAVRLASLFARDSANIVRLHIYPGEAALAAISRSRPPLPRWATTWARWTPQVEGSEIEISFNAHYLLDVLSVIHSAQVALETTTASSPGVIKPVGGDGFLQHVIMPMHVARYAHPACI